MTTWIGRWRSIATPSGSSFASPGWSEFATGGTTLALHPASPANPPGTTHFGLQADDITDLHRRLTAAANAQPVVTASTCTGDASQTWTAEDSGTLKNAQTGLCLRDPHSNHTAGAPLTLGSCSHARGKTWWLP